MNCEHCNKPIDESKAAAAATVGGRMFILCSRECRAAFRGALADLAATKGKPGGRRESHAKRSMRSANKATAADRRNLKKAKEGDISKTVASELSDAGIWNTRLQSGAIKTHSGHVMKLCTEGTPDRMFADGLIVFLEIKTTGEKPSAEQIKTIEILKRNGALVFVVDDFEQLDWIRRELTKHFDRISEIRHAIEALQYEIEKKFEQKFREAETLPPGDVSGLRNRPRRSAAG